MKDLNFSSALGSINYRIVGKDDDEIFLATNFDFKNPIVIDFIEVHDQGKGNGRKLIQDFVEFVKSEEFDLIYLFAEYDPDNFNDPKYDPIEGLKKLVVFYESLGFECFERPEYEEGFQIDMYLLFE